MESVLNKVPLAIICPVVNCLDYTRHFIETIKTSVDYRLIIIDNASTDGTLGYLLNLATKRQVDIIRNDVNTGVAPSWNAGIKYAADKYNSDYFFIPNNDVLLGKNCIDSLISVLKTPEIVLATALNLNDGKHLPGSTIYLSPAEKPELTDAPDFSCFMIKRETIAKVGLFDEDFYPAYFEDNDYHYRIKIAGLQAKKTNQALYYHFHSQTIRNNVDTSMLTNRNYNRNKEYFKSKWGGYPGIEKWQVPFFDKTNLTK